MFQIKWIWQNLKGYRGRYIFALCSTVVLSASVMVNSLIVAEIIDRVFSPLMENPVITQDIINLLIGLVITLVAFTLLRTSFAYLSIMTYETCSQGLVYRLRRDLYANMQKQDLGFYGKNRTGDLMTRLTGDMDMMRHAVCWVSRMLIDSVVIFVATAVCFIIEDPLFALTLLAVTPLIFLVTYRFSKRVGPLYVDLRERLSLLNTRAQENISGNRVVKAFAREDYEKSRFDTSNAEYKEANLEASMMWLKYAPYIDGLSQSLSIAVLLVGGLFLINGRISLGTFTLFNGLCWTLTNPMRTIGMLLNDTQRFFASANKIVELFYARSTIQSRHDAIEKKGRINGEIRFENTGLRLNNTDVLKNINLTVNAGETLAIMGPTGSGKTSLINLVTRFYDPTSGKVYVDDIPVNQYELRCLRSGIGIATQDVFLFSETVDGNIAYGNPELPEKEVAVFAKAANVDFIEKLPQGFDTVIGERGTGLSGGQKQRIALARALAVKPSILILDDTTSAVDLETEREIQNALDNLDFKCTKLIVAQRISTTKRADKIVIIDKGEIVQIGTHAELCRQEGYYREVYLLQNGEEE